MMTRFPGLAKRCAFAAALVFAPFGARAQDASSVYIAFSLDRCAVVEKIAETGAVIQRCNGLDGFPLYIAEDDLRFFVGYGPNGRKQKSFNQTLPKFNTIHDKVEFRMRPGAKRPFASILRYWTDTGDGGAKGQVLVVTKIDGNQACHMAYIDAVANKNANELAQKTGDAMAAGFNCARDEAKTVGAGRK